MHITIKHPLVQPLIKSSHLTTNHLVYLYLTSWGERQALHKPHPFPFCATFELFCLKAAVSDNIAVFRQLLHFLMITWDFQKSTFKHFGSLY